MNETRIMNENLNMKEKGDGRNDGVDACRVAAMVMIVTLHVLNFGGLLFAAPMLTPRYSAAWLLESFALCAANTYALISGYVGYGRRFRYASLLALCVQVLFYTLLITAGFALFRPIVVGKRTVLEALFPFAFPSFYWYFTAYFCMFFFIPLLNLILDRVEEFPGGAWGLAASLFFVFSLLPTVFRRDPGGASDGYSALWLGVLYLTGGLLKKYRTAERYPAWVDAAGFCLCVLVNWGVKMGGEYALARLGKLTEPGFWLLHYTSPTVLLCAVCLLNFFSRLRFTGRGKKLVRFFAPVTFGVYLIHCEPLVRAHGNYASLMALLNLPTVLLIPAALGVALSIWLACSLLDRVRLALFRRLGVRERCVRLEERVRDWIKKKAKPRETVLRQTEK